MFEVPGYRVDKLLSETASSLVCCGRRTTDNRAVVIKTLRSPHASSREVMRLRHEANVLGQLADIAGVAHCLEYTRTSDGRAALVLEFVRGHTIINLLRQATGNPEDGFTATDNDSDMTMAIERTLVMPETTAPLADGSLPPGSTRGLDVIIVLDLALAVVKVLAQLHDRRIVHKDIKPHNIIVEQLDPDGVRGGTRVRLIDFGIALLLGHEPSDAIESGEHLEGTPAYLPPEQSGRVHRLIDYRSDYYSFGAMLHHMVAGQVPFPSDDAQQVIAAHIGRRPQSLHELVPKTPRVLSALVSKLLSKAAEDRYQSARGLRADLERCLREYRGSGVIAEFPLAVQDRSSVLRPPQRLYGRDHEQQVLWLAFEEARRGGHEVALVTGPAGVGKSALVQEILWSLAPANGRFAEAKFDQVGSRAPYEGIRRVLTSLVQQALALPFGQLQELKHRLDAVFRKDRTGQVLVDLCPDMEALIGAQPPAPALDGQQAHNRQSLLVCEFVRTLATATHPLVLFFDDLQWSDVASLRTLQQVLGDRECSYLLIIVAYRDGEIPPGHPLLEVIEQLVRAGTAIKRLPLAQLTGESTTYLVADTLGAQPAEIAELAAIIERKTGGNPFFIGQFLRNIHEEGLLHFDSDGGVWRFDVGAINAQVIADNVVDFLVGQLRLLPAQAQRALALAAAIGHEFEHRMLAALLGCSMVSTAEVLRPALSEELLVPTSRGYRLLQSAQPGVDTDAAEGLEATYRFQHDRIQQAAYTLLDADQRSAVHLQIGRLLEHRQRGKSDDGIFALVRHLNLGSPLITSAAERLELARLDGQAGLLAKSKTAYGMAAELLEKALSLFDEEQRSAEHALWWKLGCERVDSVHRSGDSARAEQLLAQLELIAQTPLDRMAVAAIRVELHQTAGQWVKAVGAGRAALASLGSPLPEDEAALAAALEHELTAIMQELSAHPLDEVATRPPLEDPLRLAELDLLMRMDTPAFPVSRTLSALITAKQVSLSLRHGNAPNSPVCYMALAMLLARMRSQFAMAQRLGKLALQINTSAQLLANEARLRYLYAAFLPFVAHLREAIAEEQRSFEIGSTFGDMQGYFAALFATFFRILAGDPVDEALGLAKRANVLIRRTGNSLAMTLQRLGIQVLKCLAGATASATSLSDDQFNEAVEHSPERCRELPTGQLWYYLSKLLLLLIYEERESLWAMALLAEQSAPSAAGLYIVAEFSFLFCIAGLQHATGRPPEERSAILTRIAPHRDKVTAWASSCSANFAFKRELITAEWERLEGNLGAAGAAFERAITLAAEAGFANYAALAADLAARMWIANQCEAAATGYLHKAISAYLKWGAKRRAEELSQKHATLLIGESGQPDSRSSVSGQTIDRLGTISISGLRIDLLSIMQIAQTISSELTISGAIGKFLQGVMTHIGAESGQLFLVEAAGLQRFAVAQLGARGLEIRYDTAGHPAAEYPESITQYVMNTGRPLALNDAARDNRFAGDRYLATYAPKSILALPLTHQNRCLGVLYLENRAVPAEFTVVRIELGGLLAGQAAVAIENARLYERLEQLNQTSQKPNETHLLAGADRPRATSGLEETVERSSAERNHATAAPKRSEEQRGQTTSEPAALQTGYIFADQQLAELATPLIPVSPEVLLLPLIGSVDAARAQRTLETLVERVAQMRARAVVIDVAGLCRVDRAAADILVQAERALSRVGTQTLLSGAQAAAQLLTPAKLELGGLRVCATLEEAVQLAREA